MKNRFLKNGLEGFDDVNVFELLLFFVLPRQDTNPLAHALLNRFGSFKDVMEATVTELQSVKGIGQNTALLIRLVAEIGKRYQISKREVKECLDSPAKVFEYVLPLFSFESMEQEHTCAACARNDCHTDTAHSCHDGIRRSRRVGDRPAASRTQTDNNPPER